MCGFIIRDDVNSGLRHSKGVEASQRFPSSKQMSTRIEISDW